MVKVLEVFAFGFVFEIENENPFFQHSETDIYLNGEQVLKSNKNVISIFDLKPATLYLVEIKAAGITLGHFSVCTENCICLINIKDYNAKGGGLIDDTAAINLAIYTARPGAVVLFPKGDYSVSHILLKSGVSLYFEEGATVKQNTDRGQMAVLKGLQKSYTYDSAYINTTWEGNPLDSYCPLIYGKNVSNIRIYGRGCLDGDGLDSGFWENTKARGVIYRPHNVELVECQGVTICGIKSVNSSSWNIHTIFSERINFYGMHLESLNTSPNTDGINPESSSNINIVGCYFNVGDDCVAIKSGKYFINQYFFKKSENITIRNCFMDSGHGGVVAGSEISCGVDGIFVSKCFFNKTDRGIRVKTRRGRGKESVVSGINVVNCKMSGVKHCLTINMFYNCDPDGKSDYVKDKSLSAIDKFTPTVKDIKLERVVAEGVSGCAIFVYGLPENYITGFSMKGCSISFNPEIINEEIEMLEDFEPPGKLGVFIENCEGAIEGVGFIGDFVSINNLHPGSFTR
ncbi:MAG: glycoside hydrolase family 28 protein [Clostridiales bacterium]|jgi:polygalacturonase|nr:glycoside hydrolase family 28 protein [Clostridiales bacterium]